MTEKPKSLVDIGLQIVRDLLNPAPQAGGDKAPAQPAKVKIQDLSRDDLLRESIRLEQESKKLMARVREAESEKKKLFDAGSRGVSDRELRQIARTIKDKDSEAQSIDRMLDKIHQQKSVVDRLMRIKELSTAPTSMLKNMDMEDVLTYIDQATVGDSFDEEKFAGLLRAMGEADSFAPGYKEDPEVVNIMKAMQQAHEAGDSPAALEEHYRSLNEKMGQKQKDTESEEEL